LIPGHALAISIPRAPGRSAEEARTEIETFLKPALLEPGEDLPLCDDFVGSELGADKRGITRFPIVACSRELIGSDSHSSYRAGMAPNRSGLIMSNATLAR